jgi:hypothetical protein
MADVTIVVQTGGSANQGDTITWQNTAGERVKVTGLAGICSESEFHVPSHANGGDHGNSVLPHAPTGGHPYSYDPDAAATTATLRVNSSSGKP